MFITATNEMVHIIEDRVSSNTKDITSLEGTNITFGTKIHDNYDIFKAHIIIFGNKQYLWKLFGYKQKDLNKAITDGIKEHVRKLQEDHNKTSIVVPTALVQASKRQKRLPAGKPSGA